jgi:hypothetical protein
MKIIKQGTVEKEGEGYVATGFVVDCEGGALDLPKFLEMVGIPPDVPVMIKRIDTENPMSMSGNIRITYKKK